MILPQWYTHVAIVSLCLWSQAYAKTPDTLLDVQDLATLDIMQLIQIPVLKATSAARKEQTLTNTAAALFIITQDDIRHAGVTSIPEALRMVPGIQVARISTHAWAISARGFNGLYASKLQVLIDGRSVYNPLVSGVFWDVQDVLLEDVKRIEVIRGPGASLWGANAVNGIINIITYSASETQTGLLSARLEHGEERGILGLRYGGKIGHTHYRIYAKYRAFDGFLDHQATQRGNEWSIRRLGFRLDREETAQAQSFSLQGGFYQGKLNQLYQPVMKVSSQLVKNETDGFHLLGRWEQRHATGESILQTYLTQINRNESLLLDESRTIYDIDFQDRQRFSPQWELIWGGGYRYIQDELDIMPVNPVYYQPTRRRDHLLNSFFQLEYQLPAYAMRFTLGGKLEHNDYTGFELQPRANALWTPNEHHSLWASVARAVRTPTRTNSDFYMDYQEGSMRITMRGVPELKAENLLAYELGYRFIPSAQHFMDIAVFYNDYADLIVVGSDFSRVPIPTLKQHFSNEMEGFSYGAELAWQWQPMPSWRLMLAYSYINLELRALDASVKTQTKREQQTPHHQASLRSWWQISPRWQLDTALYYVDNVPDKEVFAYTRLDLRLAWLARSNIEISLGGRNLLDRSHREWNLESALPADEIPRSVYIQMKYQF